MSSRFVHEANVLAELEHTRIVLSRAYRNRNSVTQGNSSHGSDCLRLFADLATFQSKGRTNIRVRADDTRNRKTNSLDGAFVVAWIVEIKKHLWNGKGAGTIRSQIEQFVRSELCDGERLGDLELPVIGFNKAPLHRLQIEQQLFASE
jgi:hypothetical protein